MVLSARRCPSGPCELLVGGNGVSPHPDIKVHCVDAVESHAPSRPVAGAASLLALHFRPAAACNRRLPARDDALTSCLPPIGRRLPLWRSVFCS